jgi:hypothetical protein
VPFVGGILGLVWAVWVVPAGLAEVHGASIARVILGLFLTALAFAAVLTPVGIALSYL